METTERARIIEEILLALQTVPVFNASGTKWNKYEDIVEAIKKIK